MQFLANELGSLRKHPFLRALRRWDVVSGKETQRGVNNNEFRTLER